MQIENGKVVSFHYVLKEREGEEIENSGDGDPMLYLHGQQGMLDALQEALAGLGAGDDITVEVPPERAYGMRRPDSEHRVPLKHVLGYSAKKSPRLKPGEMIRVNTPQGERDATVIKVGKFNVDIDTNHPLAGKHLEFAISIKDVRDATDEEKAHGHAHGPGGHQH